MVRAILFFVVVAALTAADATSAWAQAVPEASQDEPDRLYREANELRKEGKLAEAEQKLERALELRRSYDTAASLGEVELAQDKYVEAAEHLDYAVTVLAASEQKEIKDAIRRLHRDALAKVARLEIEVGRPGVDVLVDGTSRGTSDASGKLVVFVEPGTRRVMAQRDGRPPVDTTVEAAAGASQTVDLPVPDSETRNGGGIDWTIAGIGFGIAGAATVAAIVVTALAVDAESDTNDRSATLKTQGIRCPEGAADPACQDFFEARDRWDTLTNVHIALWIGTGAVLIATGVYCVVTGLGDGGSTEVVIAPAVGPGVAGIQLRGTFAP